jgi:prepilin-type N-terminal cleavage/methylation domain-containing protein
MEHKKLKIEWLAETWPVGVQSRKRRGVRLTSLQGFFANSTFLFTRGWNLTPRSRRNDMNTNDSPGRGAFTLIEMIVVISIIAILAGLLLPALSRGKVKAKEKTAKSEMQNIATAISAYDTDYSRPPANKEAEAAATTAQADFTFGTTGIVNPPPPFNVVNGYPAPGEANNSVLMEILMSENRGANLNYARNPRKVHYFSPRQVSGPVQGLSAEDFVLRDPFGNPYIITLDMNDDNKCRDAFYSKKISERPGDDKVGYHGLSRVDANSPFEVPGSVMIWTFGADKNATDKVNTNEDPNKDNILSWQ